MKKQLKYKDIVRKNIPCLCLILNMHILMEIISLIIPIIISKFMDSIFYSSEDDTIKKFTLILVILFTIHVCINYVYTIYLAKTQNVLVNKLKKNIFSHIINTPKRTIDLGEASYQTRKIDQDTEQIINFIINDIFNVIVGSLKLIFVIIYLNSISRILTIILITISCLNILNYIIFKSKIFASYRSYIEYENKFYNFQNSSIENKNSILRQAVFTQFNIKYHEKFLLNLKKMLSYIKKTTIYRCVSNVIDYICIIIIIILGGKFILNGQMTIGEFTIFNNYYRYLTDITGQFISLGKKIQNIKVCTSRINQLYSLPILKQGKKYIHKIDSLSIKNFSLDMGGKTLIKNLNLQLKSPGIYGIVGKNGVGKSTLFDIILGIEPDYFGEVKINNIDIKHINLRNFRKNNISICEQEAYTFNEKEIDLENKDYLRFINKNIIERLKSNDLIDTGKYLSGGERQKVAIVKTLAQNRELILLDEPSTGLDTESIKILLELLVKEKEKNKIIILITHDNRILKKCDEIIKIDKVDLIKEKEIINMS